MTELTNIIVDTLVAGSAGQQGRSFFMTTDSRDTDKQKERMLVIPTERMLTTIWPNGKALGSNPVRLV